jgi:DNA repair protein RadC
MQSSFTLRDLPRAERPRERFELYGPEALSTYELLAIILGNGIKGESVLLVAQKVLRAFGNLRGLSEASIEELSKIKGIGLARAVEIKAIFELGKRIGQDQHEKIVISCAADVARIVGPRLNHKQKELFLLLSLDTRNTIKKISTITVGILDSNLIHPREVFKEAIQSLASSIILVHNHPSGNPNPSEADIEITKKMVETGSIIGIKVLDHVITTHEQIYSFQENGLLPALSPPPKSRPIP